MENENKIEIEEITDEVVEESDEGGEKKSCCICRAEVDAENAPMLTVNAFAAARYLCPECEKDLDTVMRGTTPEEIGEAMDRISAKLAENDIENKTTLAAIDEIMKDASERAEEIKNGTYDFSLDDEVIEEIPEELLESEEDKELDRIEEEKNKKLDKIFDWINFALIFALIAFFAYFIIANFF